VYMLIKHAVSNSVSMQIKTNQDIYIYIYIYIYICIAATPSLNPEVTALLAKNIV
jgi:hypothetical protein